MLLLADTFDCDQLKKAGLAYCEENSGSIIKTLAWKVMEHVRTSYRMRESTLKCYV